MRFYGGGPVGLGNAGVFNNSVMGANNNPLLDPRFKIQGGESPYRQPVLPTEESPEENIPFLFPGQQQLPGAGIGNVGGLLAQANPIYGDTINMGPATNDYSNMPVIPDEAEEKYQREMMLNQFRNRAFPPTQLPAGFDGKYVT